MSVTSLVLSLGGIWLAAMFQAAACRKRWEYFPGDDILLFWKRFKEHFNLTWQGTQYCYLQFTVAWIKYHTIGCYVACLGSASSYVQHAGGRGGKLIPGCRRHVSTKAITDGYPREKVMMETDKSKRYEDDDVLLWEEKKERLFVVFSPCPFPFPQSLSASL